LKFQFPSPFYDVAKIIFIPRFGISTGSTAFIQKKFQNKKWLSFYAKGFVEGSRDTTDAFACINRLLETGEVEYVFFTAETSRHIDLAYKMVKQTQKLVTIEKDLQNVISKDPRRRDLDISMVQWMMIGQADYCMANSVRSTIFAMTAFVAGPCKYVPVVPLADNEDISMCTVNRTVVHKDTLFSENPRLKNLNPDIDEEKRRKIWATVIQETKKIENQECFRLGHKRGESPPDLPSVLSYWIENGVPRVNETALNMTLTAEAVKALAEAIARNTSAPSPAPTVYDPVLFATTAPSPAPKIDKMALDNFKIDNWFPTPIPTIKPTAAPSIPYTFKKVSVNDRMSFGFKKGKPVPQVTPEAVSVSGSVVVPVANATTSDQVNSTVAVAG
jgi:hypothetical protein